MRGIPGILVIGVLLAGSSQSAAQDGQNKPVVSRADYDEVLKGLEDDRVFQRFLDKLPTVTLGQDVKRTYYVIEGDLRVSREEVRARLRQHVEGTQPAQQAAQDIGKSTDELYVMTKDGVLAKWPPGERALTYAVDRNSFPQDTYDLVVQNMAEAVRSWVEACPECGLSFTHRPEYDSDPRIGPVTFVVKYQPNEFRYVALAFFPSDPVAERYLQIMPPYFAPGQPYDRVGVLRHEIGHVLGYRHAHIKGVPGCELIFGREDNNWVALSSYDSKSVMHYPCGGGGSNEFSLSDRDKADHRAYYSK